MDCEDCKHYVEYAGYQKLTPICKECVDEGYQSNWENIKSKFEPKHKTTNADRIRSMTDEELADFIYDKNEEGSREAWLAWLKEEVDNGSSD